MPSFKPGVFVSGESQSVFNGVRFATRDEAEQYGRDLAGRWILVERTVVEESDDPVNYEWIEGHGMVSIESTKTAEA
jgi:hypothetical protein